MGSPKASAGRVTVLVDLPPEPALAAQLQQLTLLVCDRMDSDVVLEFSAVSVVSARNLATLLRLRKHLLRRGRHLVLCQVGPATQGVLSATGLSGIFEISRDAPEALERCKLSPELSVALLRATTETPCIP
jgi:anti-anti-sigma factor